MIYADLLSPADAIGYTVCLTSACASFNCVALAQTRWLAPRVSVVLNRTLAKKKLTGHHD